jgi:predicted histone-like DNA-binding protein
MPIKYVVKTKRSGLGEKAIKNYALPVRSGEINTRQLSEELSERCTLTETDIRATLIGLSKIIEEYLHKGYSVRLDDLGRFTLSATSDGFDKPEQCTPSKVKAKKICFMADKRLKENLKKVTFERKN